MQVTMYVMLLQFILGAWVLWGLGITKTFTFILLILVFDRHVALCLKGCSRTGMPTDILHKFWATLNTAFFFVWMVSGSNAMLLGLFCLLVLGFLLHCWENGRAAYAHYHAWGPRLIATFSLTAASLLTVLALVQWALTATPMLETIIIWLLSMELLFRVTIWLYFRAVEMHKRGWQ